MVTRMDDRILKLHPHDRVHILPLGERVHPLSFTVSRDPEGGSGRRPETREMAVGK